MTLWRALQPWRGEKRKADPFHGPMGNRRKCRLQSVFHCVPEFDMRKKNGIGLSHSRWRKRHGPSGVQIRESGLI